MLWLMGHALGGTQPRIPAPVMPAFGLLVNQTHRHFGRILAAVPFMLIGRAQSSNVSRTSGLVDGERSSQGQISRPDVPCDSFSSTYRLPRTVGSV